MAKISYLLLISAIFAIAFTTPAMAAEKQGCAVDPTAASGASKMDGKRFTVVVQGEGPDVVLIPGLSTPRDVWAGTVAALSRCYRFHVVQIRGFGDDAGINATGPLLDPFVFELADYIDDEIINKGRGKPAIIGHSLGGLSALMIGARYPKVVGRIMVVDALPFIGTLFNPAATVTA
jgi:pimeloyl-ACP methyl ester carboxylesterase